MPSHTVSVPYSKASYGEREIAAALEALNTSTQMGKQTQAFEEKVAHLFGKKHGIAVNSGSSALLLAMNIAGLPRGSEVIVPALAYATTIAALYHNGLVPAYVDVKRNTYCIDAGKIAEMITPNTRAILASHLLGNVAQWNEIAEMARAHNLLLIEDSGHALGAQISGQPAGAACDISTTSFYGSHIISCAGNGGMLCVNSDEHAARAKLLRSWGRSTSVFSKGAAETIENRFNAEVDGIPYDAKFVFEAFGYNLEASEIGAAFGIVQLGRLEEFTEQRMANFKRQSDFFRRYEEWLELPQQTPNTRTTWMCYPLTIKADAPFSRRDMQIFLEERGIQTRAVMAGNITRQPGFKDQEMRASADGYAEADYVMRGGVLLACHCGLTEEMFSHLHESFEAFARQF